MDKKHIPELWLAIACFDKNKYVWLLIWKGIAIFKLPSLKYDSPSPVQSLGPMIR